MGKKSVVFVAELSYMEKLEVALKSLCAHQGQWKIYVLNENLPTEWFTLMNRRLEAIDSEILNCRVSAESFKQFSLPSAHIHYATFFRYAIPEFVQENRVLYLDCDMIFTQDLSPLFEVNLGGFGIGAVVDRCPSLLSSTTVKCRWARPCRCSMPPQETAGICWAGGKSTQLLSAIWNSEALSQNLYKNNYKEITKNYCKSPSKELQYGYREGKTLLDHEIFFFLFFGISGVRHPPPAVLLRSCRPTPHRRYSASCAKESVWFQTGFFASENPEKSAHSEGKYDLAPIWWSICLFFCKGHL